jgi:hypothetical protein
MTCIVLAVSEPASLCIVLAVNEPASPCIVFAVSEHASPSIVLAVSEPASPCIVLSYFPYIWVALAIMGAMPWLLTLRTLSVRHVVDNVALG